MKILSSCVSDTRRAGATVALSAKPGEVYGLSGGLGAGKTEFVRGFMQQLNPLAEVRSPTFTLVNSYDSPVFTVYHFDFYRLKSIAELTETAFYEYAGNDGVCLVEWADMYPAALPPDTVIIKFNTISDSVREIVSRC
jgi:tRNA threonylcarbamoyladenosine biosynthesis protein TsaE